MFIKILSLSLSLSIYIYPQVLVEVYAFQISNSLNGNEFKFVLSKRMTSIGKNDKVCELQLNDYNVDTNARGKLNIPNNNVIILAKFGL